METGSDSTVSWGIIGAGVIAETMADAITAHAGSRLYAVASKSSERAAAFAEKNQVEKAMSYAEITADPAVDVIYVATTHNFHFENAKRVLEAGKHLVMEKPFTVNAGEAEALRELAMANSLFMMEAIWVRFLPALKLLKKSLVDGIIGKIKQTTVSFGNFVPPKYEKRLKDPALAGGVTLDMGIYPISFLSYMLGEIPSESKSMCRFSERGVDEIADYLFRYPSGCFAQVATSYNLRMKNAAWFYGTTGYIEFPGFPAGDNFTLYRHNGTNEIVETRKESVEHHPNGFYYQVDEAVARIQAGQTESPVITTAETVALMRVMDNLRAEWGLRYEFE